MASAWTCQVVELVELQNGHAEVDIYIYTVSILAYIVISGAICEYEDFDL